MNDTSRRKFLAAAAAGAGGVAAGTVGLTITSADASSPSKRGPSTHGKEPVVAWIEDPASDQLVLMSGDREVTVRDRDLVARLLSATGGK
ncbi:twin-arginine translocation signal domain-containing protein [Nocardioides sp. MH1]|uniref:twin-arginine translocation signal domain-containing protein n=1 Tax=Nocardioides sp. MH1 TaxID=3242490 RepID=UPI0035225422